MNPRSLKLAAIDTLVSAIPGGSIFLNIASALESLAKIKEEQEHVLNGLSSNHDVNQNKQAEILYFRIKSYFNESSPESRVLCNPQKLDPFFGILIRVYP